MKSLTVCVCAGVLALLQPATVRAHEVFGGIYKHDLTTPLNLSGGVEGGADLLVGWRGNRIGRTRLEPYVYGALNTAGDTSFAAVGISAKFGDRIYARPGLGLAVHTGSDANFENEFNDRIEFGSRVLFAPELGIGVRISPRLSAELNWIHLSHAQLFGKQNPGMDDIGLRVNFAF